MIEFIVKMESGLSCFVDCLAGVCPQMMCYAAIKHQRERP